MSEVVATSSVIPWPREKCPTCAHETGRGNIVLDFDVGRCYVVCEHCRVELPEVKK